MTIESKTPEAPERLENLLKDLDELLPAEDEADSSASRSHPALRSKLREFRKKIDGSAYKEEDSSADFANKVNRKRRDFWLKLSQGIKTLNDTHENLIKTTKELSDSGENESLLEQALFWDKRIPPTLKRWRAVESAIKDDSEFSWNVERQARLIWKEHTATVNGIKRLASASLVSLVAGIISLLFFSLGVTFASSVKLNRSYSTEVFFAQTLEIFYWVISDIYNLSISFTFSLIATYALYSLLVKQVKSRPKRLLRDLSNIDRILLIPTPEEIERESQEIKSYSGPRPNTFARIFSPKHSISNSSLETDHVIEDEGDTTRTTTALSEQEKASDSPSLNLEPFPGATSWLRQRGVTILGLFIIIVGISLAACYLGQMKYRAQALLIEPGFCLDFSGILLDANEDRLIFLAESPNEPGGDVGKLSTLRLLTSDGWLISQGTATDCPPLEEQIQSPNPRSTSDVHITERLDLFLSNVNRDRNSRENKRNGFDGVIEIPSPIDARLAPENISALSDSLGQIAKSIDDFKGTSLQASEETQRILRETGDTLSRIEPLVGSVLADTSQIRYSSSQSTARLSQILQVNNDLKVTSRKILCSQELGLSINPFKKAYYLLSKDGRERLSLDHVQERCKPNWNLNIPDPLSSLEIEIPDVRLQAPVRGSLEFAEGSSSSEEAPT